jgi:hypothetical protein
MHIKIDQHLPLQDPPKFTQIVIFGLKMRHLATLHGRKMAPKNVDLIQVSQTICKRSQFAISHVTAVQSRPDVERTPHRFCE